MSEELIGGQVRTIKTYIWKTMYVELISRSNVLGEVAKSHMPALFNIQRDTSRANTARSTLVGLAG